MRNGPNPMVVARTERHSWFVGDGMLHIVELGDGKAISYRNRYVRTTAVTARRGGVNVPGPAPLLFDGSNQNVVPFAGDILSVAEGSIPYAVTRDGDTLRRVDFGGGLDHGLSAHCKFDA